MKLTIVAATGGTGRHLLDQALAAGHDVTAVARNPNDLPRQARVVKADLHAAPHAVLTSAVAGADAVISCLGPRGNAEAGIAPAGTRALVDAMKAAGLWRLVVISSESKSTIPSPGRPNPPRHDPGEGVILRYLLGSLARRIFLRAQYADLGVMEDVVRDSGLDWTIVRPALLTNKPATGTYRTATGQKPRGGFTISRADLADFMLRAVQQPDTIGKAITITY
jgi:putative NADH-flavin reductase